MLRVSHTHTHTQEAAFLVQIYIANDISARTVFTCYIMSADCESHLYVWTALCRSSGQSQTMRWSGTKLKKHHRSYYSISIQYELNKKCTHSHFSLKFTSCLLKTNVWKLWKHDCECECFHFVPSIYIGDVTNTANMCTKQKCQTDHKPIPQFFIDKN